MRNPCTATRPSQMKSTSTNSWVTTKGRLVLLGRGDDQGRNAAEQLVHEDEDVQVERDDRAHRVGIVRTVVARNRPVQPSSRFPAMRPPATTHPATIPTRLSTT